ncbi:MAG: hypothetical protein HZB51_34360 [Chloroflexi bacterium]|nr:hypothetical protein [Chloroflexota bacterium]
MQYPTKLASNVLPEIETSPIYCSNNCGDTTATQYYVSDSGARIYLCDDCAEIFEMGQVNPEKHLHVIGCDPEEAPNVQDSAVSHGVDCLQRICSSAECTCFKSRPAPAESGDSSDDDAPVGGYGSVDVAEKVLDMMLAADGFKINPNREDDNDIMRALDQATILHRETLLTMLNCAEADLIGLLERLGVHLQSKDVPPAQTVRDLHRLIQCIDPRHRCSVDQT